jgi:hypothetical protein
MHTTSELALSTPPSPLQSPRKPVVLRPAASEVQLPPGTAQGGQANPPDMPSAVSPPEGGDSPSVEPARVVTTAEPPGFPQRHAAVPHHNPGSGEAERKMRFRAFVSTTDRPPGEAGREGIWDAERGVWLSNFVVVIEEDVTIEDDFERQRIFRGRLLRAGRDVPFEISAKGFADNHKFQAALFEIGGPEVVIDGRNMNDLRSAVSMISTQKHCILKRRVTKNFGWNADRSTFLVPGGAITAEGFAKAGPQQEVVVDIAREELARFLDLVPLANDELLRVKQHIVEDLLRCQATCVTYPLLAATALAPLLPFAEGMARPALWLTGMTGSGKSFAAKLFANFFGSFPLGSAGRFATWTSTVGYIQRQGFFFNNALFVVDDFKPEFIPQRDGVRLLQTYADDSARGRLKPNATSNRTRPIRGLLVSTGEDILQYHASALARCVVVPVPQGTKDVVRGNRCVTECRSYSGVMADFLHWLLVERRTETFAERVKAWQRRFFSDVAGLQNDLRIAGNFALLAAAFDLIAEYLGDVWPAWKEEAQQFTEQDLLTLRNNMLGEVREQQASEIFVATLAEQIRLGRVKVEGLSHKESAKKPLIGKVRGGGVARGGLSVPGQQGVMLEISTRQAFEAVQNSLRRQGRPLLKISDKALLAQLLHDGWLLGPDGQPVSSASSVEPTQRTRLDGRQVRCFLVSLKRLLGEEDQGAKEEVGL